MCVLCAWHRFCDEYKAVVATYLLSITITPTPTTANKQTAIEQSLSLSLELIGPFPQNESGDNHNKKSHGPVSVVSWRVFLKCCQNSPGKRPLRFIEMAAIVCQPSRRRTQPPDWPLGTAMMISGL